MNMWGSKSDVGEITDRNNFEQYRFMTYVSPLHPTSDHYAQFVLRSVDFSPMVIRLIRVFESILFRGIPHKGVHTVEINGNFLSAKKIKIGESQKEEEEKQEKKKGKTNRAPSDLPEAEAELVEVDPKFWISVLYRGEDIRLNQPCEKLTSLLGMLSDSPWPSRFDIEINDGAAERKYVQTLFGSEGQLPELRLPDYSSGSDDPTSWTKVTFHLDPLVYDFISSDILDIKHIVWKRVIDTAVTLKGHLKVLLDGIELQQHVFHHYVLRYPEAAPHAFNPEAFGKRLTIEVDRSTAEDHHWELAISMSNGEFQQISFVNGLSTVRGGTHVELVKKAIMEYGDNLVQSLQAPTQDKEESFSIEDVRVFINLVMKDPTFDSNAKDRLVNEFEGAITLNTKSISKRISKYFLRRRTVKPTPIIDSLVDAHEAGGKQASECYLILTEGEPEKTFALSGMRSVDRRYYGVLSLLGKMPNIKTASAKSIFDNEDISNIMQSLGLVKDVCYNNLDTLRYGHLVLMTNQDTDGFYTKGLVISFLYYHWPSLIQKKNFLFQFITPIIKVTHDEEKHEFFSMPEYKKWESTTKNVANWKKKYYKGLASHTAKEAQEYFKDQSRYMRTFQYSGVQDLNAIDLSFPKYCGGQHGWEIMRYEEGNHLDLEANGITYTDFLNKVTALHFVEDIKFSMPSMVDGLKLSQRKVLFSAFKINLVQLLKVAQFSAYICEQSVSYQSQDIMSETIIRMAQKFVGSNNVNLLLARGLYGTRRKGGKNFGDPWCIDTCLSPLTRIIFRKHDDPLLNYLIEDGQSAQPSWYLPIIPMVLVNGCDEVGMGWSTVLPKYDPRKIIANLKCILTNEATTPLIPWFRGFKGTVDSSDKHQSASYQVNGVIKLVGRLKFEITELPPSSFTDEYKCFLEELVREKEINSFEEDRTRDDVKFTVTFTEEQFAAAEEKGLQQLLKLSTELTTDNIYLIDSKGSLKKYLSVDEIVEEFCACRLPFYQKRKEMMLAQYADEITKLQNIARYVHEFHNSDIIWVPTTTEFIQQLREKNYGCLSNDNDFRYIRELSVNDLLLKRPDEIAEDCVLIEEKRKKLCGQTPSNLWIEDLEVLEKELDILDKEEDEDTKIIGRRKRQRE